MNPQKLFIHGHFATIRTGLDRQLTIEEAVKIVCINEPHPRTPYGYVPLWNGHEFEVSDAHIDAGSNGSIYVSLSQNRTLAEYATELYWPSDPRSRRIDWHGAYKAVPNADNTAWEPRLTEKGTHHDYERTLLGSLADLFVPIITLYRIDSLKATDDQSRSDAQLTEILVGEYYFDARVEARKLARALYLGQRVVEAHPDVGYIDADSTAAVEAVRAQWAVSRPDDLADLSGMFSAIKKALDMPDVELPWEYRARISNANLRALTAESKGLGSEYAFLDIGAFDADTLAYSADVSAGTTEVRLAATPEVAGAKVSVASPFTLMTGANAIPVTVTALDGSTVKVYTVTITRAE